MLQSIIDSGFRVRVLRLRSIKSESSTGLTSIEMFVAPGTRWLKARQMVQERMVLPACLAQRVELADSVAAGLVRQPVAEHKRINSRQRRFPA